MIEKNRCYKHLAPTERILKDSVRVIANTRSATYVAKRSMLFVSLDVCDKSLRHETTTTRSITADFLSRPFLLHICNSYGRATNYTTGAETKIHRPSALRAR